MSDQSAMEFEAALARVRAHEASIESTLANRVLRRIGPTRAFSAFYRRFGPRVDPWLLRRTGGRFATKIMGAPALLLLTIGAKTGKERTSPLLYARDGDDFVIVGTNFGTTNHPAWTGNLLKNPEARIVVGEETLRVTAKLADEATFERLWPSLVSIYPGYQNYLERLTHRKPRMFVLSPHP